MKKIQFLLVILTISTQFLIAQNIRRANHLFENRSYIEAATLFLGEENKTQEVYEKLGDCYYFNTKMKEAAVWYKYLLTTYGNKVSPAYYYRYSQALKGINNYKEADIWFQKYNEKNNIETNKITETLPFFESLNNTIKRPFLIHKLSVNTEGSDFGVSFFGTKAVFSSTRNKGELYDWNNQPYLDLFIADIDASGELLNATLFSKNIKTKMHESNAVFTNDGKTMYFTRNNFIEGKKGRDENKITHLKVYRAQFINNEWTDIIELPFNSNNYSTEHPALSSDEKLLYFASDMPGSIGSFDLFVVEINDDGTYGTPKNLGPKINTEQREQFPFMSSDHTLYFASDGHFGLGGLDIFKSNYKDGKFETPQNLSSVINSNLDDFAFVINNTNETGYFSSNREGGTGDDDIYRFTKIEQNYLNGIVQDKNTLEILPGTVVTLYDGENNHISEVVVGEDAKYSFEILKNSNYKIKGTKKLYITTEIKFKTNSLGNIDKDIFLLLESYDDAEKNIAIESGKAQIKINPIYFDFNKWNIRKDAAIELDSVVVILKKYPEMKIEIGAHTDSRGKDSYNLTLSQKRAKSVRDYFISQGINIDNINFVGYGESQPLNKCLNDVFCTEKEYDINRRCEFVILN